MSESTPAAAAAEPAQDAGSAKTAEDTPKDPSDTAQAAKPAAAAETKDAPDGSAPAKSAQEEGGSATAVDSSAAGTVSTEEVITLPDPSPPVEPTMAFDAAREAVQLLHGSLARLKTLKAEGATTDVFSVAGRETQLQLLALRRAHRAMGKAAELSRQAEAQAWKATDLDHAHLETQRYESACNRAAARQCRALPTPHLSKLRPCLLEASVNDADLTAEEKEVEGRDEEELATVNGGLKRRLDAELKERARLDDELTALETVKAAHVEALRRCELENAELLTRLTAVERALEPITGVLPTLERDGGASSADKTELTALSGPLRVVFAKFDALVGFSAGGPGAGVRVRVEPSSSSHATPKDVADTDAPSAKRMRSAASGVCVVDIAALPAQAKTPDWHKKAATLRFSSPATASIVLVTAEGRATEAMLDSFWLEDSASREALSAAAADVPGRACGWVQVLAGLREQASSVIVGAAGAAALPDGVTASDIVQKVRAWLAEHP